MTRQIGRYSLRRRWLATAVLVYLQCQAFAFAADVLVYVGTRGSASTPGRDVAHGVYAARLDSDTGSLTSIGLVAEFDRAAWLLRHPSLPVLYSVGLEGTDLELEARIRSFAIDTETGGLRLMDNVGAGGKDATHLDFDKASQTLFSANHGSGSITAIPVMDDGSLGGVVSTQTSSGGGPHPRQGQPEMHAVAVAPDGRFVAGADFGADKLVVYRFDAATRQMMPAATPFEAVSPASGPRHLRFHPNGRYLFMNNEMIAQLQSYRWNADDGSVELIQSLDAFPRDFTGTRSTAEILVSDDGRFLYQSLRGEQGAILVLAIDEATGTLSEIQRVPAPDTPWSLGIDPSGRWMLVMNQSSETVNVMSIDPATGHLGATEVSWDVPSPVAVTFFSN